MSTTIHRVSRAGALAVAAVFALTSGIAHSAGSGAAPAAAQPAAAPAAFTPVTGQPGEHNSITDVPGIQGTDGRLVSTLGRKEAERLVQDGVIDGGMLPKVESALRALEGGTAKAHIIDGRVPHAILLELFTREGVGTEIVL